uniref:Protein-tyrosine phosphatase n=1 Tax=Rhabditophanes sp. KR3021 TaxID=114890 RepID=A0AC35TNI9_9BILA
MITTKQVIENWVKNVLEKGVANLKKEFEENKRYFPKDMTLDAFKKGQEEKKNRINRSLILYSNLFSMILQEQCTSIIMLCGLVEKGQQKCAAYWPVTKGETKTYDNFEVTAVEVSPLDETYTNVVKTQLLVKSKVSAKEMKVNHFYWTDWPDRGVPANNDCATTLLDFVRGSTKPIVVHCSAGIGRTGSIVAIEYIFQKFVKAELVESSIEILKSIRNQRPYSIQTYQQYLFIHRNVLQFIANNSNIITKNYAALMTKFEKEYEEACVV